jgi:membrane associated rhomboid family serine protease
MRRSPSRWEPRNRRVRGYFNFGLNPVWAIIIANLVIFVAMMFASTGSYPLGDSAIIKNIDKYTYYLGLIPYYFTERPWTVFTAMFVHAGFGHLFGNMITLFFFGSYLSRLVGNSWFTIVYFVGGLAGNLLYLLIGDPLSIAVGASGAVCAVAGALAVLAPNIRVYLYFIFPMPLWVVVLVFFLLWSFIPGLNIAWQAHIGGLAVGLVAGYYFRRRRRIVY